MWVDKPGSAINENRGIQSFTQLCRMFLHKKLWCDWQSLVGICSQRLFVIAWGSDLHFCLICMLVLIWSQLREIVNWLWLPVSYELSVFVMEGWFSHLSQGVCTNTNTTCVKSYEGETFPVMKCCHWNIYITK